MIYIVKVDVSIIIIVTDEVLTLHEHLEDACSMLFKARTEWFNIGLTLGVDSNTLTAIRQEHSSNHGDSLQKMLAHRMAMDSLTWGDLCKSLRHVTVERSDVADEIEGFATALMQAAQNGHVSTVEVLIAAGAPVNIRNEVRFTACLLVFIMPRGVAARGIR